MSGAKWIAGTGPAMTVACWAPIVGIGAHPVFGYFAVTPAAAFSIKSATARGFET
jgi:hypothetical protein